MLRQRLSRLPESLVLAVAVLAPSCGRPIDPAVTEMAPTGADPRPPETEGSAPAEPEGAPASGDRDAAPWPPMAVEGAPEDIIWLCDAITDDAVLAAAYEGPKMPPGYYEDAPEEGAWPVWAKGCADDMEATIEGAQVEANASSGWLTGETRTTPYFHEVDIALSGGMYTIYYRKTRCDYWNGTMLGGEAAEGALSQLAVYLWYSVWAITGGYSVVDVIVGEASGAQSVALCEVRTWFAYCGQCDSIALVQSAYKLAPDGKVWLSQDPATLRVVNGHCDK